MKVSIIIPVYNVEAYIERCIRSVMSQTYTDMECILVDDCTPDNSMSICERLINEYRGPIQFKPLHHERNRGLSAARNTGTAVATGEYIYYLDSDDEITPDCIFLLIKETQLHPEVKLVQGGVKSIPYDEWFDLSYYRNTSYIDGNDWIRYNFFKAGEEFPVMAWNKLIRRDFLASSQVSFKEGLIHEDELWTLQLVKKLDKIAVVGQSTYLYYKTDNSIMSTLSKQRSARNWMYISRQALKEIEGTYMHLQLFKYLWILLDRFDYGYKSKEGKAAAAASITALLKCGHRRLALRFLKYYLHQLLHKSHGSNNLKDYIASLWEKETYNSNCH